RGSDQVDAPQVEGVDAASISVSGILIDATGEKLVATRRGERLGDARPRDPTALVADVDIVVADNRFPDFVRPILQAAVDRGIPAALDGDRATTPQHPQLPLPTHLLFLSQ